MPLSFEQETFLWEIQEAKPGSEEEANALAFIRDNPIEFEDEDFCWTPLITAIQYKRDKIIDALLAKGADIHHVTQQGTTALATAIAVNDTRMIAFLHPQYKARWPKGEDRIVLERYIAYLDEYYPTDKVKSDEDIREHRAKTIPLVNQCRTQPEPLSSEVIQAYETGVIRLQRQLKEREENKERRKMVASLFTDEKQRAAFIEKDTAASIARLDAENRLRKEKEALELKLQEEKQALSQKAAELEQKAKDLETQLQESERKRQTGEQRVKVLLEVHAKTSAAKMDKQYIKKQPILLAFWKRVRSKLNELFIGQQARASGMLVKVDKSKQVEDTIMLAGDIIPLPGAKIAVGVIAKLVGFGLRYRQEQVEKREHDGFSAMASDVVEFNAVVEPTARVLTLGYEMQLVQLDEKNAEKLGECAVRLMLVYLLTSDPRTLSALDQEGLVAQLVLAVRTTHTSTVKLKDHRNNTVKPKEIEIITPMGTGKKPQVTKVLESKLFALYVDPSIGQIKRHAQMASKVLPVSLSDESADLSLGKGLGVKQPVPQKVASLVPEKKKDGVSTTIRLPVVAKSQPAPTKIPTLTLSFTPVKPQPVKAEELRPRAASPVQDLVLKSARQQKAHTVPPTSSSLLMVE